MSLTVAEIKNAKLAAKPVRLFDGAGLYLEVAPSGGKWWRFKYSFGGKEKRLSLGVYPDVSLKEARERRDKARSLVAAGVDPGAARKAEKRVARLNAENSFEAIAREWYAKYESGWSQSHATRNLARLQADVFPWIGGRPIADLTPIEVLHVLRRIEKRGALETAHRLRGVIGQVMRYGVATGHAVRDITADLRGALPPAQVQHYAAITDPEKVGVDRMANRVATIAGNRLVGAAAVAARDQRERTDEAVGLSERAMAEAVKQVQMGIGVTDRRLVRTLSRLLAIAASLFAALVVAAFWMGEHAR